MPLVQLKVSQRGESRPTYAFFESMDAKTALNLQQLLVSLRVSGRVDRGCIDMKFDEQLLLSIPSTIDPERTLLTVERACKKKLGIYWERTEAEDKDYEDMRRASLKLRPHLRRLGLNPDDYLL